MSGLNLHSSVRASVNAGTASSSGPATATEAAYGPGYSASGTPSTAQTLTPNDPFGIAFWSGIGALVLLLVIRHSLPN